MALGKLFGYFRKFAQNFPSCVVLADRESEREGEGERDAQSFASHVICIVLHPFGLLREQSEVMRGRAACRMLLLLSTIFYVPIGKIHARLSREWERERGGKGHLALGRAV